METIYRILAILFASTGLFQSLTFIGGTVQHVLAMGLAAVVFAILSRKGSE